MIKNYIKIAFRNLLRDRSFSILNLVGLAIGLASVIMIMGYVRYELSYDTSYSNHQQVFRLIQQDKPGSLNELRVNVNEGMGPTLKSEFPAVVAYTPIGKQDIQFKHGNDIVKITTISGKSDFFKIFNFPFIGGNPQTAMREPGSLVLTETAAKNFFKGPYSIGDVITDQYKRTWHVTGIIKDLPLNMHLSGDAITSDDQKEAPLDMAQFTSMPQYVLLNKNTDPKQLEQQFRSIYKKYKFPKGTGLHLQAVTDIHLHSHYFSEISVNSDIKNIYIFSSIALLILVIACINYINLTTARSLQRAREIGLRKVLGALRKQLIIQFLTESFLFFFISTFFAVIIAYTLWPIFSAKITSYQQIIPLFDAKTVIGVILIFVLGGLLSGAYPAFFLSSLQPVKVLKGLSKFGVNISLRKALVVLQFTISGVLIISTLVVNQQLSYISNAKLGFNKDNLITVPYSNRGSNPDIYRNELLKNSSIQSVTLASWRMGEDLGGWNNYKDKKDTAKEIRFNYVAADIHFIKTMGIHILKGRDFSASRPLDIINPDSSFRYSKTLPENERAQFIASLPIMVNQATVDALELKDPVGTTLIKGPARGTIIAVFENFNGLSLHQKVDPVIIKSDQLSRNGGQLYIRISSANTSQTISYIETQWKKLYPNSRFDFAFTDDKLQQLYAADKRFGTLVGTFSTLAIIIACMGLFGLISLTVQNRVKEIGIRKVLGASIFDITRLISADFLKLVFASFVISSPIAWYFMNKWLQDFAYRINIEWWVFSLACALAIFIAFVTLSFQSIKAAMANPVKSLRNE